MVHVFQDLTVDEVVPVELQVAESEDCFVHLLVAFEEMKGGFKVGAVEEPLKDLVEGGLLDVEDRTDGTVGEQGLDVVPVPLGHFGQLLEVCAAVF